MKRLTIRLLCAGVAVVSVLAGAPAAVAAGQPVGPAAAGGPDVTAVVRGADGLTWTTMWTPAAGVSAHQLYLRLLSQGVRGLVDPSAARSSAVVPDDPADCSIDGAYAWDDLCNTNRWHWPGTHPQVNFDDHTGAAWPVDTTVAEWNTSSVIDSLYHGYNYSCVSNCVDLSDANYGATGWTGITTLQHNGTVITYGPIRYNDYAGSGYVTTPGEHTSVACHEEGHALGLGHNVNPTCMYAVNHPTNSTQPGTGDWQMLISIY